ncbi:MAG: hypothetical protein KA314_23925 [Chloroflexi bacterium]|nr:hypothetical protein [Chloroflexota bacterium]MBP8058894.1 hypothetical protein [Chloroflexota bacterium]
MSTLQIKERPRSSGVGGVSANQGNVFMTPPRQFAAALETICEQDWKVGLVRQADKIAYGSGASLHLFYVRFRLINSYVGQTEFGNSIAANL